MPISVRLGKEMEGMLEETAKVLKTNKTAIIKHSLSDYCTRLLKERKRRPYEMIKDLLGKAGSGRGDLSLRGEQILREAFRRRK